MGRSKFMEQFLSKYIAKGSSNLVRAFSVSSSTANHLVIEINLNFKRANNW